MTLLFTYVCDLLQQLSDNSRSTVPQRPAALLIRKWFQYHRRELTRNDHDASALLSTLLPQKRTDRVYGLREKKLQSLICRGLFVGYSSLPELATWSEEGATLDLAECAEKYRIKHPLDKFIDHQDVTVEEVDKILNSIASNVQFSSPAVRAWSTAKTPLSLQSADTAAQERLQRLYCRLSARDVKWLTRLVLKNFDPVVIDPRTVYSSYHPLLPNILQVHDDFDFAEGCLHRLNRTHGTGARELAAAFKPVPGIKVGRQQWQKARSIKHCLGLGKGRMSCEEKMDGEYAQVHVVIEKANYRIQIYSKSGKDSTSDRVLLHEAIETSLRLGQADCPLRNGCILEGEMVVWSDQTQSIRPFHKIRKYVNRSGVYMGTALDSQRKPWERLMIVWYDAIRIDDTSLLGASHSERFARLSSLVGCHAGYSAIVKRQVIDFQSPSAASELRHALETCMRAKKEGLVLKPDEPYFDFLCPSARKHRACVIKMKPHDIASFGDVGDFAVVGARYEAQTAKSYSIDNLRWTHFYIGCITNKEQVVRSGKEVAGDGERWVEKPHFVVTNVVTLDEQELKRFQRSLTSDQVHPSKNNRITLSLEAGVDERRKPSVVFLDPPVLDIRCYGFDRAGNTGFWSLRFPQVTKIHTDRTWLDAVSFEELQKMAAEADAEQPAEGSQEDVAFVLAVESDVKTKEPELPQPCMNSELASHITPSEENCLSTMRQANPAGQLTPPTSSADKAPEHNKINRNAPGSPQCPHGMKRPASPTVPIPRKKKTRTSPTCQCEPSRAPFRDTQVTSPRRNSTMARTPRLTATSSMYQLADPQRAEVNFVPPPLPTAISFQGTPALPMAAEQQQSKAAARSRCAYACPLSRYSILLSPCVSGMPLLTETLLPRHGVRRWTADVSAWRRQTLDVPTSSGRRRPRCAAFVESRRAEATRAFVAQIREAGLPDGKGAGVFVEVWDWRILEQLTESEERGRLVKASLKDGDDFKKYWMGLA